MATFVKNIALIFKNAYLVFSKSGKYILLVSLIIGTPRAAIMFFRPDANVFPIIADLFSLESVGFIPVFFNMLFMILGNLIIMSFVFISRQTVDGDDIYLSDVLKKTFHKLPALIVTTVIFYILLAIVIAGVLLVFVTEPILPFTASNRLRYGTRFFAFLGSIIFACAGLFYPMIVADRNEWGFSSFMRALYLVYHDTGGFLGVFTHTVKMLMVFLIWGGASFGASVALSHMLDSVIYIFPNPATLLAGIVVFHLLLEVILAYFALVAVMYYMQLDYYSDD